MSNDTTERTLAEATIYWDVQDRGNEGWAYRLTYTDGHRESGAVDGMSDHADMSEAETHLRDVSGVDFAGGAAMHDPADGGVYTYIPA